MTDANIFQRAHKDSIQLNSTRQQQQQQQEEEEWYIRLINWLAGNIRYLLRNDRLRRVDARRRLRPAICSCDLSLSLSPFLSLSLSLSKSQSCFFSSLLFPPFFSVGRPSAIAHNGAANARKSDATCFPSLETNE